jgi:hypothetical protein
MNTEQSQTQRELTLGEKRCHINFNPSSDDKIGQFKRMMADAIDFCANESQASYERMKEFPLEPEEEFKKVVILHRETERCFKIAMEHLETAQMYAVKGIAKGLK